MNRNYILQNKENELFHPKSPIKLKINYQARQTSYERTKSPLQEESLNRRANLRNNKENRTPPLTPKNPDYNCMYFDESSVQPVSKLINDNGSGFNNHCKSTPDPSMIKPISLQLKQPEVKKRGQEKGLGPQTQHQMSHNKNDLSYSKSVHRQNSKHLQFFAKVGNLEKMNNQISSLLSYVYENKTAPKEQKRKQDNSSYKHRYGMVSQNPKSYQRRLSGLEKPKQAEPLVSNFEVEENHHKDPSAKKERRKISKYQYSNFQQVNKSPYRMLDQNHQSHSAQRGAPNHVRRDISPNHSLDSTHNVFDEQVGVQKNVKSQNFNQSLTPSEQGQQLSKITTSNNPDLEFYYDSLKKRDEEIQNFKKKFIDNEPHQIRQYFDSTEQSLSEKYKAPFKRRNQARNFTPGQESSLRTNENYPQKDVFITKEEIEIYKDINKINHHNYQERSSINRLERIAERRANLAKEIRQQANHMRSLTPKSTMKETRQNLSNMNQDSFSGVSRQISKIEERKSLQRNTDSSMTSKIDEQIQKIKNELRDCNKEKSYMRKKYSSILTKEASSFDSKGGNQFQAQDRSFNERAFQPQRNEVHMNYDNERMFDSENKKRLESAFYKIDPQQNYHNELRQKIYSEDRRQIERSELVSIKKSQIYEDKAQNQFKGINNHQNTQNKQIGDKQQLLIEDSPVKQAQTNLSQQERYQSFGQQVSRQLDRKRQVTPNKQFKIQLHKVQITKPQTTKFATLLADKIQINLKLRNQRQKFVKSTNVNKWNELKTYLQNRFNISKTLQQLQQLIAISPEQHNPFSPTSMSSSKPNTNKFSKTYSFENQSTEQIPLLCSLLAESLQFFDTRFVNKLSPKQLQKEHFSFKELDLNSKGYLSLQDLICFVNLHSGQFYRNRDIIFFVKLLTLRQKVNGLDPVNDVEYYNSAKGVNEYRLNYEFLWNVLTKKQ